MNRDRSDGFLPAALLMLILTAGGVFAFVPLIDPPRVPWPLPCDVGGTPEKITLLERARRTWTKGDFGGRPRLLP